MRITINKNIVIQACAMALQYLNVLLPIAPEKYKVWITVSIALVQATVAGLAHYSNPDGTPATTAYKP
jgi:hypothetical protein